MNLEIKQRIKQIKKGQIPQGYKKTKIGIMPNEWEVKCLGEIGENFDYGMNAPAKEYDNKNKYIRITDIDEDTGKYLYNDIVSPNAKLEEYFLVKDNDILFARTGASTGKTYLYNKKDGIIYFAGFLIRVNIKNDNNAYYIFQNTMTVNYKVWIQIVSMRSGQPGVNAQELKTYLLPVPPLAEQQKIAEILSTQDKLIELKEKLIKEKQKQKKYLMQNLLIGKIRLKVFTDEWKKYVMGNLGNTYSGLSGKNKDDFGKGKPYIPYTNIFLNPIIDVNELGYVDVLENEKQSKVCYGDIFFTTSSETPEEVGMSSVLLENVDELYLNSFCFGFRLNNFSVLSPIYASHYFRGDTFRNILNRLAQGATRFNLSKNNLLKSILLLPPLEEQKAIAEILSTQDKEIKLLQKELEEEKQKKKALMQLLLTGIVRV